MRIISGTARGRRLASPDNRKIRPTTDRVKESLFSMLQPYIEGALFADICAGSGNIGFEALSRGAKWVDFVDNSSDSCKLIRENAALTGLKDYSLIRKDAVSYILDNRNRNRKFDMVFADPPYKMGITDSIFAALQKNNILESDGLLIIETSSDEEAPKADGFELVRRNVYGDTAMLFYRIKVNDSIG